MLTLFQLYGGEVILEKREQVLAALTVVDTGWRPVINRRSVKHQISNASSINNTMHTHMPCFAYEFRGDIRSLPETPIVSYSIEQVFDI